uniref:Sulfotransferase domain-containing protein n=1 Tax=viral metagenome TaxID=1070528 RepID=A0A6C0HZS2_9ZZZZ
MTYLVVSFPRSGQSIVQNLLSLICHYYNINHSYCEYYSCCNTIPCSKGCLFQKVHDFKKDIEIDMTKKYIVLYRKDPILQMEAFYRFEKILKKNQQYNYDDLKKFIKQTYPYYNYFINKWVNNDNENILKIEFYDLINTPFDNLKKIFSHLFPDLEYNEIIFKEILEIELIDNDLTCIKSTIKQLNYMDDEIYNKLKLEMNI